MGKIKYYAKLTSRAKDALVRETLQPLMKTCTREVERGVGRLSDSWTCRSCGVRGSGDDTYHKRVLDEDMQFSNNVIWALLQLDSMPDARIEHYNLPETCYVVSLWNSARSNERYTTSSATLPDAIAQVFLKWCGVIDEKGKIVENFVSKV